MKSSVSSKVCLTRESDLGPITITMGMIPGMPPMIEVEQRQNGSLIGKVSLTQSEADFFRYILNEFNTFLMLAKRVDGIDDDD